MKHERLARFVVRAHRSGAVEVARPGICGRYRRQQRRSECLCRRQLAVSRQFFVLARPPHHACRLVVPMDPGRSRQRCYFRSAFWMLARQRGIRLFAPPGLHPIAINSPATFQWQPAPQSQRLPRRAPPCSHPSHQRAVRRSASHSKRLCQHVAHAGQRLSSHNLRDTSNERLL